MRNRRPASLLLSLVLTCTAAGVGAEPFANGDPTRGKALVERSCRSCHASLFGGDPARIYMRPDRKVGSVAQLTARVHACNVNAGAGWSAEDERHAAAFLNQSYYKFK